MSIFDRLKSLVGSSADAAFQPAGPLGLQPGSRVGHYDDSFTVFGVRILAGEGSIVHQYCMRDAGGTPVVLAAEAKHDSEDGVLLTLQRAVEATVRWDTDVIEGIADEPFKITQRGRARVRLLGDTGIRSARSVDYREFEDAEGERLLVLEDYGSVREIRLGEPVFEAELVIVHEDDAETWEEDAIAAEIADGDAGPGEVVKGSPLAAAMALDGRIDDDEIDSTEIPEDEPEAFEDDAWADADFDAESDSRSAYEIDEEDELDEVTSDWLAITRLVKGGKARASDIANQADDWLD